MITNICIRVMHRCAFILFSFLLLCIYTTIANKVVAVEGRAEDDNGAINKCLDKERHALLHFKALLQDPNDILSTWTAAEEDDCCIWFGVTCNNQTGHVTKLSIHFGLLGGEISPSLLNLRYLNHLDLSVNSFSTTIPTFIGSMTRFRYLNLGNNGFIGTIPTSIGFLTNLRYLNLESNNINGTIPRSIGFLTRLRYLDLSNNSLYGTVPPEFGNLTILKKLFLGSIGSCRVENLDWLSHLSYLQEIDLSGISLAKANYWVDVILSFRKLSYLTLRGCELSQVMYPYSSFLNSSSSIVRIELGYNSLNSSMYHWLFPLTSNSLLDLDISSNMLDGIPKYLGNLCSLAFLYMSDNSVVVKFPDFLNNLSGCTSVSLQGLYAPRSQLTGLLSDVIQKFSSLEYLYLHENNLSGTISEKLWELPKLETLDISFNCLRGSISKNIGKSKPFEINLSKNSLEGVPSIVHMSNLSYVDNLDMSSCKLGSRFPIWIQTLKNLTHFDISNNKISDIIPLDFWNNWPSHLRYLNLSSNNISAKVLDLSSNFVPFAVIDLSSNNFFGPISNVSSALSSLNLSRNKLYGGIAFLCQIVDGFLSFLDLSHNSLTGQLPDCLWHFKELQVLNLGHNNLYGRLPPSVGSLIKLKVLYLYKNNFSGKLPFSLKNCTSLNSLNLGANNFSGNVPAWIGEKISRLYVLILRSNNFYGTITLQLCELENLHILDLSMNKFHGTIPLCLNNLTSMVQQGFSNENDIDYIMNQTIGMELSYRTDTYVDHAMLKWQGDEREFYSNLRLLKSIDLSSNDLSGKIPYEITNLYELLALNLSKNALHGELPLKIGQMDKLLVLDLSKNNFSGGIPSSMSQMTFLSYLDVSSNNLSGRIPSSTQLQTFEPLRYSGNTGLCGPPLTEICPEDEESKVPPIIGKSEADGEDIDELWGWFYIGGGTGFAIGFWMALGILLVNRRGRHAFSRFLDNFKDWVYVKVVVFIATL